LAHIADVDEWPDELDGPQPHFVVLLAMDATSVDAERVAALAAKLMNQGMVYLCAWGPGCERVHDIVDGVRGRRVETDEAFLVTTWHAEEDLDDALWDAVYAVPTDDYIDTCRAVLAIVVDGADWSERVEAAFTDFEAFDRSRRARTFPNWSVDDRSRS
jgi:hypothetical protein